MADAAVEEKKEGAEEAAQSGGKGGSLGPLLGLVAVVLVAVIGAWMLAKSLAADPVEPADGTGTAGGEGVEDKPKGPVWDEESPVDLGEILANVNKEGGRRYVKATVQIWVKTSDTEVVNRPDVLPSLVAAVQDRMRSYSMDDFQRVNQKETMNQDFTTVIDRTLREMTRAEDRERRFVTRVVFNFLVQ